MTKKRDETKELERRVAELTDDLSETNGKLSERDRQLGDATIEIVRLKILVGALRSSLRNLAQKNNVKNLTDEEILRKRIRLEHEKARRSQKVLSDVPEYRKRKP